MIIGDDLGIRKHVHVQDIDVVLVEDSTTVRHAVKAYLSGCGGLKVVGEAADGYAGVAEIEKRRPAVAIVDIGLPGMDGVEVVRSVKEKFPELRVVMLTARDSDDDIFSSLGAGADAYVLKRDLAPNLEIAIRSAKIGAVWLDPRIASKVLKSTVPVPAVRAGILPTSNNIVETLTEDEKAVLGAVAASDCKDGVCFVDPEFVKRLNKLNRDVT